MSLISAFSTLIKCYRFSDFVFNMKFFSLTRGWLRGWLSWLKNRRQMALFKHQPTWQGSTSSRAILTNDLIINVFVIHPLSVFSPVAHKVSSSLSLVAPEY